MRPLEENEELKSAAHVEVDGWLSLQMHRDHFALVQQARHLLTVALVGFLHSPHKQGDKAVAKGFERLSEVLTYEQNTCFVFH